MARRLTRREITLLGVLGAAGVAYLVWPGDEGGAATAARATAERGAQLAAAQPPRVQLDVLEGPVEDYDPRGRNLFQYYVPPPPPPPPVPTPPPTPPPTPLPQPVLTAAERTPPAPPAPRPPQVSFKYVGYLGPKDNKIAVLEEGAELLLVRRGDVVQAQFRIMDFGYQSLVVGYVDERFKGQTTEVRQTQSSSGARKR